MEENTNRKQNPELYLSIVYCIYISKLLIKVDNHLVLQEDSFHDIMPLIEDSKPKVTSVASCVKDTGFIEQELFWEPGEYLQAGN
jgi:hypothetical protein